TSTSRWSSGPRKCTGSTTSIRRPKARDLGLEIRDWGPATGSGSSLQSPVSGLESPVPAPCDDANPATPHPARRRDGLDGDGGRDARDHAAAARVAGERQESAQLPAAVVLRKPPARARWPDGCQQ